MRNKISNSMDRHFSSMSGLKVLVVDSNSDSQYLLSMLFQMYGIETIATDSASEALEILERVQPDLLISELLLPGEDGFSLLCKVKALGRLKNLATPAIALTTYISEEVHRYALAVGFCRCLCKPLLLDELITVVAQLTGQVLVPAL